MNTLCKISMSAVPLSFSKILREICLQNLREAIATNRNKILRQPDEMKREASLSTFVEYLERYYYLICFAVYVHSERKVLRSSSLGRCTFADWMKARPELYSIIRR